MTSLYFENDGNHCHIGKEEYFKVFRKFEYIKPLKTSNIKYIYSFLTSLLQVFKEKT